MLKDGAALGVRDCGGELYFEDCTGLKKRSRSFVMNYSGQIRFIVLLLKHCDRYMFVVDF